MASSEPSNTPELKTNQIDQYSIGVRTWAIKPSTFTPTEIDYPNQNGGIPQHDSWDQMDVLIR